MINNILNPLRRIKASATVTIKKIMWSTLSKSEIKLIVVGAQKGGTTALYRYLSEHPDIQIPNNKEIDYFNGLGDKPAKLSEYQKNFPASFDLNKKIISIDVSPSYLLDAEFVAGKIHTMSPSIKIVVLLREPVSRAISSWFMYKKLYSQDPDWFINSDWVKNNSFKQLVRRKHTFGEDFAMDIEEEVLALKQGKRIEYPIIEYGLYKKQLSPFIKLFGRDNILILDSNDLKESTQTSLNQITSLIGLKPHTLKEEQLNHHFVGDNKHEISKAHKNMLNEFYQEHNHELKQIVGDKFTWLNF